MKKTGFIYLWKDTTRNRYYLGSHVGTPDDGYIGSGVFFMQQYKKRPSDFRRRILEYVEFDSYADIQAREEHWLSMIRDEELGKKYYNLKKVAAGGDIFTTLSDDRKRELRDYYSKSSLKWHQSLTEEQKKARYSSLGKKRRAAWTDKSKESYKETMGKTAILTKNGVTLQIKGINDFCRKNGINAGNMKNMLRGNVKSCAGWTGKYV